MPSVTRLVAHALPARAWNCAVFALRGARVSPSARLNGVVTLGRRASVGWRCVLDAAPGRRDPNRARELALGTG